MAPDSAETLPPLTGPPVDALARAEHPLRIAFFSKTKRHTKVPSHFIRAFRANGHKVFWLRSYRLFRVLGRSLATRYMKWYFKSNRPDLIVVYSRDIPMEVMEATDGIPKGVFYEDVPQHHGIPNESYLRIFRQCDVVFTTARGLVPEFKQNGVNAQFLVGGCDPVDHFRDAYDEAFASEVAFIGQASGVKRLEVIAAVRDQKFALKVYGRSWKETLGIEPVTEHVFPTEYRKICRSAAIVLGVDFFTDIDLYTSNRTWLTLGCGGFLLTNYVPALEEFFTNQRHLVWFKSTEECLELIRYYLEHPADREKIALAGYEFVQRYHTFRHAAARIVDEVMAEANRKNGGG